MSNKTYHALSLPEQIELQEQRVELLAALIEARDVLMRYASFVEVEAIVTKIDSSISKAKASRK